MILSNVTDLPLERRFSNKKVCILLVVSNLSQSFFAGSKLGFAVKFRVLRFCFRFFAASALLGDQSLISR
jgi:hypothetical protein